MTGQAYTIKSKVFLWHASSVTSTQGAWHFITVPKKESEAIKKKYAANARGWGSLPVTVKVGKTEWSTSIFPDSKSGTYLLPLKAEVRKKEGVQADDKIRFTLVVRS